MGRRHPVLLFDKNLRFFNDIFREEAEFRPNITVVALRQLTPRHCPPGTRGVLMDELMQLRKKKGISVREYSREFRTLLRMIPLLEHGENEAVPEADVVRMYKMGMPVDWQVELHRISRGWDLPSMKAQFELIEKTERDGELLPGNRQRQRDQQPRQRPNGTRHNNQRPRSNNQRQNEKYYGFCKRNSHNGDECYRDPASAAYRPRITGGAQQYQYNRNRQTRNVGGGGGGNRYNHNSNNNVNNASMAAMQDQISEMAATMKTLKKRQEEEYAAAQFYDGFLEDTMASRVEISATSVESEPSMEIKVQLGSVRLTTLLDTGCTNSAIAQQTLRAFRGDVVLKPETAKYRNTDKSIGQTTHSATSTLKLLEFSNTRHTFRVAETLLYPVMLGEDFLWKQKMVTNFEDSTLKWDGIEIKMPTRHNTQKRSAAVLAADMECRAEIAVDEPEPGLPSDLIATHRLTED